MKRVILTAMLLCTMFAGHAQSETTEDDVPFYELKTDAGHLLVNVANRLTEIPDVPFRLKIVGTMDGFDIQTLDWLQIADADKADVDYFFIDITPRTSGCPLLQLEELDLSEVTFTSGCYTIFGSATIGNVEAAMLEPGVLGWFTFSQDCHVKRLVLPESINRINKWAMSRCTSLREVVLPSPLTTFFFQSLPGTVKRVTCRSEEPPVVMWPQTTQEGDEYVDNSFEVQLQTTESVDYWRTQVSGSEYRYFDDAVLVVPKGSREKYASPDTGSLFSFFKNIVEEGETTAVPAVPQSLSVTAEHAYTVDGRPAARSPRGVVVSNGEKILR